MNAYYRAMHTRMDIETGRVHDKISTMRAALKAMDYALVAAVVVLAISLFLL